MIPSLWSTGHTVYCHCILLEEGVELLHCCTVLRFPGGCPSCAREATARARRCARGKNSRDVSRGATQNPILELFFWTQLTRLCWAGQGRATNRVGSRKFTWNTTEPPAPCGEYFPPLHYDIMLGVFSPLPFDMYIYIYVYLLRRTLLRKPALNASATRLR